MHILLIRQAFAALDEPGGMRHHKFAHYITPQRHQVRVIASPGWDFIGPALSPGSSSSPLEWGEGVTVNLDLERQGNKLVLGEI
jgi:hypothetical protein